MIPWVSVKDMIPDSFVGVLLYMPNQYPLQTVHEGYYANGYWFYNGKKLDDTEVVYWSPMPEGPKSEEDKYE